MATKNKIIIVLGILVIAVTALFLFARYTFGDKLEVDFTMIKTNRNYDVKIKDQKDEVTYLTKESGEDYKVLAFTDLHFDGMDQRGMDKTMGEFLKVMNEECPDLVVFTGDVVTAIFNKERAEILADVMETYGVYWCTVLGNHEGEHPLAYSRENLIKLWADDARYPHCLVQSGPEDVSGYGNYVVNLMDADLEIHQSLIFLDSGDYVTEEDVKIHNVSEKSYDYIKADQIAWYQEKIKALPEGTKSSLFIHIPLSEYATGWDAIYDKNSKTITDTEDCNYISGMQREAVCCSEYNSGLFDVMVALGSTKAVYCGHDHINDYSIALKGIELNYLQASGYSTYGWNDLTDSKTMILEEQSMQGYSILTMKNNDEFQIVRTRYKK